MWSTASEPGLSPGSDMTFSRFSRKQFFYLYVREQLISVCSSSLCLALFACPSYMTITLIVCFSSLANTEQLKFRLPEHFEARECQIALKLPQRTLGLRMNPSANETTLRSHVAGSLRWHGRQYLYLYMLSSLSLPDSWNTLSDCGRPVRDSWIEGQQQCLVQAYPQ